MGYKLQIRALREAKGLTQRETAQQLHVTPSAVAKWETGDTTPTLENLIAMSTLFCCSLDALLGREPPERTSA